MSGLDMVQDIEKRFPLERTVLPVTKVLEGDGRSRVSWSVYLESGGVGGAAGASGLREEEDHGGWWWWKGG